MSTTSFRLAELEQVQAGDTYTLPIEVSEELVERFAALTGDYNPLHMDETFAVQTPLKGRVVHGMLPASFLSTVIGMHLPGPGALWLSQSFEFVAPVRIGDALQLQVEVTQASTATGVVTIHVEAANQHGQVVMAGTGKVQLMQRPEARAERPLARSTALVIGAGRGLGAAIAKRLAASGCRTIVNYRSADAEAQALREAIAEEGGTAELLRADVRSDAGIARLREALEGTNVDIVVFNAAGALVLKPLLEQGQAAFEEAIAFGVRVPLAVLSMVLPGMVERRHGRIVSILSTAVVGVPPAHFSSYVVGKAALMALTKSVAVEYGKHGICANMVSPGMLRTGMMAQVSERVVKVAEAQAPSRRLAEVEEVAEAVAFLCAPQSASVNGQNLIVAGGSVMA